MGRRAKHELHTPADGDVTPSNGAPPLTRRQWLGLASGGIATMAGVAWFGRREERPPLPGSTRMTLYASESCQCCHGWKAHMEESGFTVATTYLTDVTPKKDALGVPAALRSCHTAEVGGYVVEGHVPADILKRFLAERPTDRGLAAPGMPGGSPGMETVTKAPFDVIAFAANGTTRVYARA